MCCAMSYHHLASLRIPYRVPHPKQNTHNASAQTWEHQYAVWTYMYKHSHPVRSLYKGIIKENIIPIRTNITRNLYFENYTTVLSIFFILLLIQCKISWSTLPQSNVHWSNNEKWYCRHFRKIKKIFINLEIDMVYIFLSLLHFLLPYHQPIYIH